MELQPFVHECLQEFSMAEDEKAEILYQCSVHCVSDVEQLKCIPQDDLETKLQIPLGIQAIMRKKLAPPQNNRYSITSPAVFTAMSSSPPLQGNQEMEDVALHEESTELYNPGGGDSMTHQTKPSIPPLATQDSIVIPIQSNHTLLLNYDSLSSYPLLIQSMVHNVSKQRSKNICCFIFMAFCILCLLGLTLFWTVVGSGGIALVTLWGTMDFFSWQLFLIVGAVGLGVGVICMVFSIVLMGCCCLCWRHREQKHSNLVKQVATWYKTHDLIKDFSIRETENNKSISIKY